MCGFTKKASGNSAKTVLDFNSLDVKEALTESIGKGKRL